MARPTGASSTTEALSVWPEPALGAITKLKDTTTAVAADGEAEAEAAGAAVEGVAAADAPGPVERVAAALAEGVGVAPSVAGAVAVDPAAAADLEADAEEAATDCEALALAATLVLALTAALTDAAGKVALGVVAGEPLMDTVSVVDTVPVCVAEAAAVPVVLEVGLCDGDGVSEGRMEPDSVVDAEALTLEVGDDDAPSVRDGVGVAVGVEEIEVVGDAEVDGDSEFDEEGDAVLLGEGLGDGGGINDAVGVTLGVTLDEAPMLRLAVGVGEGVLETETDDEKLEVDVNDTDGEMVGDTLAEGDAEGKKATGAGARPRNSVPAGAVATSVTAQALEQLATAEYSACAGWRVVR